MLSRGLQAPGTMSWLWNSGTVNWETSQGRGHQWLVTWQKLLSVAILSLVSLTAPGKGEGCWFLKLFCNSCWTRLEGKFKELESRVGSEGISRLGKAT